MQQLTLKEYINHLNKLLETYGDLPLLYSSDEEGNYIQPLYIGPSAVYDSEETGVIEIDDEYKANAICIN